MKPRPYQLSLACDVLASFENVARSIVAVLPTGGGKSPTLAYIATHEPGRIWVIAHRQELIRQLSGTLDRFSIAHGIVKAGYPFNPDRRVQVASVQTLARRHKKMPPPDLIIWDECHHCLAATYRKIHEAYPAARNLGVTATPCRTNGQGLGEIFDHMVLGPSVGWLTDNGFLSPAEYYAPPQVVDTDSLPVRAGDFAKEATTAAMDKPTVTGDAVEHYRRICDGVPTLVFCTSVAHAEHVAEQYAAAGYRATSVDGKLDDDERTSRIGGLADGRYQVLTSCDLIGEGLDVPIVGAVQLLRPTASLALHLQQLGRGLRPNPGGGVTYILDHVGNVRRHGFASTVHPWSLNGSVKRKRNSEPSLRTCGHCFLAHEPAPVCPMCGYEYPKKENKLHKLEEVDGKLVRIEETREERAQAMREARSLQELIAFAKARGYNRPAFWARKVFFGRSHVGGMPRL